MDFNSSKKLYHLDKDFGDKLKSKIRIKKATLSFI
jgi:hypothetical protein